MSEARQAKRQTGEQTDKAAAKARRVARKPKVARPAYVQAKMSVSHPSDPAEREADQVADEISRMPHGVSRQAGEQIQTASTDPGRGVTDPDQTLTPKLSRRISRRAIDPEEESLAPKLYRQGAEDDKALARAAAPQQAQRAGDQANDLQRQADPAAEPDVQAMADEPQASPLRRQAEDGEDQLQTKLARSTAGNEEAAHPKLHRATAEAQGAVRTQLHRATAPAEGSVQTALQRQAEEEEEELQLLRAPEETPDSVQTSLYRAAEETDVARTDDAGGTDPQDGAAPPDAAAQTPGIDEATEQQIDGLRGQGEPLPDAVLQEMNQKFGHDFSAVRIHTDGQAAALCARINARAFAVGDDLFFAPGEFAPDSEAGRKLLAHELTHVVQQSGAPQRMVHRDDTDDDQPAQRFGEKKQGYIEFPSLVVPSEFVSAFNSKAPFILHKAYDRARNDQTEVWRAGVNVTTTQQKLSVLAAPRLGGSTPSRYIFEVPSSRDFPRASEGRGRSTEFLNGGSLEECARQAAIPKWDKQGSPHESRTSNDRASGSYDVDHMVEQRFGARSPVGGFSLRDDIHGMGNFFLLDGNINRTVKVGALDQAITDALNRFRDGNSETYGGKAFSEWTNDALKGQLSLKFLAATGGEAIGASGNNVWTKDEIDSGAHIDALTSDDPASRRIFYRTVQDLEEQVPANKRLILFGRNRKTINPDRPAEYRDMLSPFELTRLTDQDESGDLLRFSIRLPARGDLQEKELPDPLIIRSIDGSERVGEAPMSRFPLIMGLHAIARGEESSVLEHKQTSPISVEGWEIDPDAGMVIRGRILPSLPMLRNADIDFVISGRDITFSKTFSIDDISVPPPLSVDQCSLTVSAGTRGIGVEGQVDFGIERLGTGYLRGMVGSDQKLGVEGSFNFDSTLFDPAEITIGYVDGAFHGEGRLGIPGGKVPGIRSATITANFSEEGFGATGEAELDIPGVESGTITISQSEEEGFVIGGSFNLSPDVPGIRGGTISAELRERPDGEGYSISASGEAQPDIPGINSNLRVSYEDGAITMEADAQYERGMLNGSLNVGATNRTLDSEGNPTGEPGDEIIVYGGGSLTIQIAPWLQGTAGVQFAPNGEITVTGEIGLPDQLEIFPRAEIDKSIFSIAVQAPIVPGIVAEVGGGLGAVAGIGPGVIDQLRLGIEYNPAHEENTHITGDAHLSIPADAGLRLSVRAGIGLGITGASATGGLEIGGTLGITGAAEAGVHIDWMPSTGLAIDANVSVHAQPSFTFDIAGYVSVRALGFSVYDQTWELASFSFGSDYRFGISLPVHYREGEPFNVSLDDVEFEVPDINTDQLLSGLIDRIA